MATVPILSVYKHIASLRPRRVALIAKDIRIITRKKDGIEEEVDRFLSLREQLFLSQLQSMGIQHVEFTASTLQDQIEEFMRKPQFDLCVITGEPFYQLFEIGARIRKARFKGPIFLEITEEDAEKPSSIAAAQRNASAFKVEGLLRNLVYMAKSVRDAPKKLDFDILSADIQSPLVKAQKRAKKAGPLREVVASPVDISEPPQRTESTITRIIRDTALARSLKIIYGFRCQICGDRIEVADGVFYAEVHHVKPLGGTHKGLDVVPNMLVLCPNHHAMFDYGIPTFTGPASVEIRGTAFRLTAKHQLDAGVIDYHNETLRKLVVKVPSVATE